MKPIELTQTELKKVLTYDPSTGQFKWRVQRGRVSVGEKAGSLNKKGYNIIRIFGIRYMAHRLAWLYVTGSDPGDNLIDHINRIPGDDRIKNLRLADNLINSQNTGIPHSNNVSTGILGVTTHFNKKTGYTRFKAYIRVGKKRIARYFQTLDEARVAYIEMKRKYHEGCTI